MLNKFFDKYIFTSTLKYKNNNFFLVNIPFLIVPVDLLVDLIKDKDIKEHKRIYREMKESVKEKLVQRFEAMGLEKSKRLELIKTFFVASGWGAIQLVDLDEEAKRAIAVIDNSPFATELKGKAKFPVDVFMRGILAGLFSSIFEENIDCVETECAALNSKNCKLILKPTTEFDLSKKVVQEQLPLEE
jgi:predicted hydrocarbon binding protein